MSTSCSRCRSASTCWRMPMSSWRKAAASRARAPTASRRRSMPDAVYGLKSMDGVCPKLGVGAIRINSDIVTLSEAGQHGGAREGPGRARQPLGRPRAAVLGRQRRAARDHARRRDAAHARRRHQRPRHQISRAQERRDGRHPRHRLAGRLAAHGGVRRARHQADPLLQPDAREPRNIRGADDRHARRRGPLRSSSRKTP